MTGQECTLKEMFVATKLDELQPTWRDGADIKLDTKQKIQKYIQDHYSEIISPDDSFCLTFRSIEMTVMRLRKKLDIKTKMSRKEPERNWNSINSIKNLDHHDHDSIAETQIVDDASYANVTPVCHSCMEEPKPKLERKFTLDLVPIACHNPECDKFALVTKDDKWYFFVTLPLRKGKLVRPYCSQECQSQHETILRQERIKGMAN